MLSDELTSWPALIAVLLTVSFLVYHVIYIPFYNIFLHPLAAYPGPLLWRAYRLPYVLSIQRGDHVHDIKNFHDRYGRVIRIAPNELSTIEAQAWQDIYGHRQQGRPEFQKNPIWAQPTPNGEFSLINAEESKHRQMRKPLAHAFSVRNIKDNEPLLQSYVTLLVQKIGNGVTHGRPVFDLKDYYNWLTFDVFGDLGFGEPFGCLEQEQWHEWVSFLFAHLKAAALLASISFYPTLKNLLFRLLPKSAFEQARKHHDMSADKVNRRLARGAEDRKDVLSFLLNVKDGVMTAGEMEGTAATLILAGSEGTSALLTAVTNFLVRHPEKLAKLEHEIRTEFASEDEITLTRLEHLPYIEAVLREGMRVAPPVPTSIPRIVPPGDDIVNGVRLPGGTFIGLHQFSAYRHSSNFALADHFIPERWLPTDSPLFKPSPSDPPFSSTTFANDDVAVLQPFSVGPRSCAGTTLARHELRLVIGRLVWNFDLAVPGEAHKDAMRPHSMMPGNFKWEEQKTFSLWERQPCQVQFGFASADGKPRTGSSVVIKC